MCGRYQLDVDEGFFKRYKLANKLDIKTSYNIAPSQLQPTILQHSPNHVEMMYWGLIPFWEEKKEKPKGLINIRDDTLINKSWGHKYLQFQRCLVPATGFYEWKRTQNEKIPYNFKLKDEKYFSFAGLYSEVENKEGSVRCYAIITTDANEIMKSVHSRMPVILSKEDENIWLNPDNVEIDQLKKMLKPYSSDKMEKYPISSYVNNPSHNDPSILNSI